MQPGVPTHDEIVTLRDIMLLHLCLETLEHRRLRTFDDREIERTDRILEAVTKDFIALKKWLKEKDIRVLFDMKYDKGDVLQYPFICRGYEDNMFAFKDHFRGLIKEKLKGYKA